MARRFNRRCRHPGCMGIGPNGWCAHHTPDMHRGSAGDRGYDSRWNRFSAGYKRRHPLCALCEAEGRTTPTAIGHHMSPVSKGGAVLVADEELLPVCAACHPRVEGLGRNWRRATEHQPGRGLASLEASAL